MKVNEVKEIKEYLKKRYPNDQALQKITDVEITRVINIYCNNFVKMAIRGFLSPFGYIFSMDIKIKKKKKHITDA